MSAGGRKRFADRTVLVTGGGRGTGAVIARLFAEEGAHVVLNHFHSADETASLRDRLRASGHRVDAVRASVARPAAVDAMFDELADRGLLPDVLVNSAASGKLLPLEELDDSHWQRGFDTNVGGALSCSLRAARTMPPGSAIVNVSSVGSTIPFAHYASIGVTKAALESLTRYLALELAPRSIRVNAASAALLDTPETDRFPDADGLRRAVARSTPLGRLGTAEELAELVLFLASDAASWVTGQVLLADGGLSLGSAMFHPLEPPRQVPTTRRDLGLADDDIVIVGSGVVAPGVSTPNELWAAFASREDNFTEPRPDRFPVDSFCTATADQDVADRSYARRSGYVVAPVLHPAVGEGHEITTSWLRHCLLQALDPVRTSPRDRALFAVGYGADANQEVEEALAAHTFLNLLSTDDARAAVRARFGVALDRGQGVLPHRVLRAAAEGLLPDATEYVVTDGACSSSLYALDLAVKALLDGDCDIAFAGGAFAYGPRNLVLFSKLTGLSRKGKVRSLDRSADGVVFADGAGVLVLKTARRAMSDGDEVLGVVDAIGLSCDGKGKAIYAPNEVGQVLALRRAYEAWEHPPVQGVIGHLTGTRAGDSTEVVALGQAFGPGQPIPLVANKVQTGHTGWAAGAVAVVSALEAFRRRELPAQHFFDGPITQLDGARMFPPTESVRLDEERDALRLGVSAFGFGGTNAHVVLRKPGRAPTVAAQPARSTPANVVVVGWSTDVPDEDSDGVVRRWLTGDGAAPTRSFGGGPSTQGIVLPASVLRLMDRCQVMVVRAHRRLPDDVLAACAADNTRTGVVVGHMGPTTAAARYAARCYLDELRRVLDDTGTSGDPSLDRLVEKVTDAIPVADDDSFPGMMANVIAARLAALANYRGLNLTVDDGRDSGAVALRTAERYLRHGDLDFAVVASLNGNSAPEFADIVAERGSAAEGAFLVVLCTEQTARLHGLLPLATVSTSRTSHTRSTIGAPDYLGAGGAVELLRHVLHRRSGVVAPAYPGGVAVRVTCEPQGPDPADDTGMCRAHVGFRPTWGLAGSTTPLSGVVVVDSRDVLADVPLADGTTVLAVAELGPEPAVAELLPDSPCPVWVLVDAVDVDAVDLPSFLALHDLVFEIGRSKRASALSVLVRGGIHAGARHPVAGLFEGLVKSLAQSTTATAWHVVHSDRRPLPDAVRLLVAEAEQDLGPVVVAHDGGARLVRAVTAAPPASPTPTPPRELVVVAAGGARGITAECLVELAGAVVVVVHLLGRGAPADGPVTSRHDYLAEQSTARPGVGVRTLNEEYDRMAASAAVADTVRRIEARGPRVEVVHHVCDLTVAQSVADVIGRVLDRHGRVDLLVNSAALYRPATLEAKTVADFRTVRDTKVHAYVNLRAAFAGRQPAHWVNFGSWLGIDGWPDEPDYCAANDMLAAAAEWHRGHGHRETTIAWPLWSDAGNFADPLNGAVLALRGGMERLDAEAGTALFVSEVLSRDDGTPTVTHVSGLVPLEHDGVRNRTWTPDLVDPASPLAGHRLNGVPALPASVAYLTAARATGLWAPGAHPPVLRDCRLLLPVVAGEYEVRTDPASGYTVITAEGRVHASMLLGGADVAPVPCPRGAVDLVPCEVDFYTGHDVLHLDGAFRSLVDVVRGPHQVEARFLPGAEDAADDLARVVDAVFQAALLAARAQRAGPLVPVGVDLLAVPSPHRNGEPLVLRAHHDDGRVVASALTPDGTVVVHLAGLHTAPLRSGPAPVAR